MDRNDDIIIFTPEEQARFNVSPQTDVETALDTAEAFLIVAHNMQQKSFGLIGSGNHITEQRRRVLVDRAYNLVGFAGGITRLCVPEEAARMVNNLDSTR